ncbi:MAG: cupin-like domain-containing protein [Cyanobacteriota bacterium]
MDARTSINNLHKIQYDTFWFFDHVLGKDNVNLFFEKNRNELKKEILKFVQKKEEKGKTYQIERRKNLTIEEFKNNYLRLSIPVVLEGAAKDWACVKNWTPEFLGEKYGSDEIQLIDASPSDFDDINYKIQKTTLKEVIMSMDDGPIGKYSRFNRILHDHPELKEDFDLKFLKSLRNTVSSGQTFQVFIGGKGTKTHLHCASEHNLFTQVYGRKHWTVYPPVYDCVLEPVVNRTPYFHSTFDPDKPDYEKFPAMEYLDKYECILEPGDIFFNPPSYWHHVNNLSGSIGVAFRWFALDAFKIDFMQTLLTIMSVNPPFILATKNRTDFPKIFEYMSRVNKK